MFVKYSEKHDDYIFIKLDNPNNERYYLRVDNFSRAYFQGEYDLEVLKYDKKYYVPIEYKLQNVIYYLGENYFSLKEKGDDIYRVEFDEKELGAKYSVASSSEVKKITREALLNKVKKPMEYLRLIFVSLFYILGIVAFTIFYIRENIFDEACCRRIKKKFGKEE